VGVLGGLKMVASIVIIAAVCGFFYGVMAHQEIAQANIDRYGCSVDHVPVTTNMVLIDRTDPYSTAQTRAFKNEISRIRAAVKPTELLVVASIGGELPAAINFRACSPQKGDVPGILDSLRENRDWVETQHEYEERFQQPIEALADEMPLNTSTPNSPIIQSVADVMEQLGPYWSRVPHRKITLITDGMENTAAFSQCDERNAKMRFSDVRIAVPYIRETPLDLRGVQVTMLYLTGFPHDKGLQGFEHQRFWRDLVAFYGGEVVDWVVVPNNIDVASR